MMETVSDERGMRAGQFLTGRHVRAAKRTLWPLVACAALIIQATGAAAQPVIKVAPGEDLRPLYANVQEVAEGKRIAEVSCARCHGVDGVSSVKGSPHLAGQRSAYLYLELKTYKAGARSDKPMEDAARILSEQAMVQVSAYYASLPPPPPAKLPPLKAVASRDPLTAGKAASAGCAGCHGDNGVSRIPGTPSLVGLDQKYFVAAMNGYKTGQRKDELMKSLVSAMSEADINNLALYYATLKPARAQTPVAGNQAAGKEAAAACSGCHGERGVSTTAGTPSLAGQDAQYLVNATLSYKDGSRSDDAMKAPAAALDDRTLSNIAAFYAAQQPQAPRVSRPMTTAQLAQRCDRCHGLNGNSTDPRMPAIGGQRLDYLEKVLHAYRTGARKSPEMAAMSSVLTEEDVVSLANHYARQPWRPVVYVVVPSK
jgi:cytochrome c553